MNYGGRKLRREIFRRPADIIYINKSKVTNIELWSRSEGANYYRSDAYYKGLIGIGALKQ